MHRTVVLTSKSIKYHQKSTVLFTPAVHSSPFRGAGFLLHLDTVPFSSVAQSCPTLCDSMDYITPGPSVYHQLPEFTQTHVLRVRDAIQQSHPLLPILLLPSIFPSIRVFCNKSVLLIRWPKYWSFSFSISPSNEYSGLISFRMD